MLRNALCFMLILTFLLSCKTEKSQEDNTKDEVYQFIEYNSDEVEAIEFTNDDWDLNNFLSLSKVSNYTLEVGKYGSTIKGAPYPFIHDDVIIFNTKKGVIWYSLVDSEVVNFKESFKYLTCNIPNNWLVLIKNDKIQLTSILDNKIIWEIDSTLSKSVERAFLSNDYLLLIDSDYNTICLSTVDGSMLWKVNYKEKLKLDYSFSVYRYWKTPEGPFYNFPPISNFIITENYLVYGIENGRLLFLSLINGELKIEIDLKEPANGPVTTYNDKIYLGGANGTLYVISSVSGELINTIKYDRDFRALIIANGFLYGMGRSSIFKINLDDYSDNKLITEGFGTPFPENISISGGYLWKSPTAPYDTGFSFDGFNLKDFDKDTITFAKEGRGYAPMEVAEGQLEEDKNLDRFKKNHLLEWNDHFILVEPDEIVGYKIVPQE